MKNTFKVLGIIALVAIIGFSMTACGEKKSSSSPGKLTITGLSSFNGKYAMAMTQEGTVSLVAANSINFGTMEMTGSKIENGSVILNVWSFTEGGNVSDYKGSDRVNFVVAISGVATFSGDFGGDELDGLGSITGVRFQSGTASGAFTAIE